MCACVSICGCMPPVCRFLLMPEGGIDSSGAGVTASCEPPDVVVEK